MRGGGGAVIPEKNLSRILFTHLIFCLITIIIMQHIVYIRQDVLRVTSDLSEEMTSMKAMWRSVLTTISGLCAIKDGM